MKWILKRLTHIISGRAHYQAAIRTIKEAIRTGVLSAQEKRQRATQFVEPKGWRFNFEGIDWVELGLYTQDAGMPFESVADLLAILKRAATN